MFSIYILMLSKFSNQKDIVCSIIHAGRDHQSCQSVVGFFVNAVLFKIKVQYQEHCNDFLQRVHQEVLGVLQHHQYPVELVFDQLKMRYPDIPVSFNMLNIAGVKNMQKPVMDKPYHMPDTQEVKYDIEVYVTEYEDKIDIYWTYKKEIYAPSTIEFMMKEYAKIADFFTNCSCQSYNDYKKSIEQEKHTFRRG
jgi:hypothetical protein